MKGSSDKCPLEADHPRSYGGHASPINFDFLLLGKVICSVFIGKWKVFHAFETISVLSYS